MDVDKTKDDSTDNTETKDDYNDIDFLLDGVISETKQNNKICFSWYFDQMSIFFKYTNNSLKSTKQNAYKISFEKP